MSVDRIQKVLSRAGVGSRRQVEQWIESGRLTVNGEKASPGARISERDRITLDGRTVRLRPAAPGAEVLIYHRAAKAGGKPAGEESAPGVAMQLPGFGRRRWIPITPLPVCDSGLELLTDDGDLAYALTRCFHTLLVQYAARVHGDPRLDQLQRLKSGQLEEGEPLKVESVELEGGEGVNRWFKLTVLGGRGRDVHKLFAATGLQLSRLIRVSLGPIAMDRSLARGRIRKLEADEVRALYALAGLDYVPPPSQSGSKPGSKSASKSRPRPGPKSRSKSGAKSKSKSQSKSKSHPSSTSPSELRSKSRSKPAARPASNKKHRTGNQQAGRRKKSR